MSGQNLSTEKSDLESSNCVEDMQEEVQSKIATNESNDTPISPRAIAAAAVAEAKAQRKHRDDTEKINVELMDQGEVKSDSTRSIEQGRESAQAEYGDMEELHLTNKTRHQELERYKMHSLKDSITGYWDDALPIMLSKISNGKSGDINLGKVIKKSSEVIFSQLEELADLGQGAFQSIREKERELVLLSESHDAKEREVDRLKKGDEANRESLANLLRAIETSKGDVRGFSHAAHVESRLRSEIADLQDQNDKLNIAESDTKRKSNLLGEELRLVKGKLNRVTQDKIKLERDARATISLARSLDNHASSDNEFYRRKVAELNDRLQAKNALIAEQQNQLEDMRRQMERSLSQSRLAQLRAEGGSLLNKRSRT